MLTTLQGKRKYAGILSLLMLLVHTEGARANIYVANSTELGNELATLSDGGAFANPGTSFRHSYCDLYREMINGRNKIDVSTALNGQEISVLLLASSEYVKYNEETGIDPKYPGLHPRILDHIAKKGNFTWRTAFGVWDHSQRENRSITDFIFAGVEKYDLMVGTWTPTAERMKMGISFVDGHSDGSFIMVRVEQVSEAKISLLNFLRPFDADVWFVIIAVVIASSFAYQLIEGIGGKGRIYEQKSIRVWLMDNLYLSFINFTGNYSYEPKTLGGRFFGFVFAFWAMLITAAYTANLASLLVIQHAPDLRLRDIQDAVDRGLSACTFQGSVTDDYMRREFPQMIPDLVPRQRDDLFQSLNRGECDFVVAQKHQFETSSKQIETNPTCTLRWEGRMMKSVKDGFASKLDPAIECTNLVSEVFNYYLKKMEDDGSLAVLWQEHFNFHAAEGHCEESEDQEDHRDTEENEDGSLSLDEMAGTMLFQAVGSVIAILIAIISSFESKTRRNWMSNRTSRKQNETDNIFDNSAADLSIIKQQLQVLTEQMDTQLQVLTEQMDTVKDMLKQVEAKQEKKSFSPTTCRQRKNIGSDGEVKNI